MGPVRASGTSYTEQSGGPETQSDRNGLMGHCPSSA
ncbi:uncharacterized protein G2W53_023806 [Senna tora]|uniref:Uncharacterized protein n=1 Tax=Senna tora TaxID=362788 RepID=A0A834TBQ1_9FABA|nr:uncharacterized protein G2W53_023806 [Senna tora]